MTTVNEQRRRAIALQAIGEYLINHIAGVMEMVQDERAQDDKILDEEALVTIEAEVKAIAEELTHQSMEQLAGGTRDKEGALTYRTTLRRKGTTNSDGHSIHRVSQ